MAKGKTWPVEPEFERRMCQYTGAEHGVAVSSGTAALHITCLALGLGREDRLWTSPVTFVASANCGLYCGAGVDFVDIAPETGNMSVDKLRQKLMVAKKKNQLSKIVVAVHLAGLLCDMAEIRSLSQEYGFYVIKESSRSV